MKKQTWLIMLAGALTGLTALVLTANGNPANMGFCIACFLRDTAGSLGLHSAAKVQYLRPEIAGIVLGALGMSVLSKEFRPKAGSAPALRFVMGALVTIGALAFLGCPLRMLLRLAGGDLTALSGLAGFVGGILVGVVCLKNGFSLGRNYPSKTADGIAVPAVLIGLLVLGLSVPGLFRASTEGPGASHAFWLISLIGGLVVGVAAQKSRLCMAGGIRDVFLFKNFSLISGFGCIFAVVLIGNLILGNFNPTVQVQPVAHHDYLWNFLGLAVVGWGSVLLGGCPLRQLILSGEGNADSGITILGMLVGAAISHNFGFAGNADAMVDGVFTAGGVSLAGQIAVVCALVVLGAVSVVHIYRNKQATAGQ